MKQVNKDELNKCNSVAEFNDVLSNIPLVVYVWRKLATHLNTLTSSIGFNYRLHVSGIYCLALIYIINDKGRFYRDELLTKMEYGYSHSTGANAFRFFLRTKVIKRTSVNGVYALSTLGHTLLSLLDESVNSLVLTELARQQK